MNPQAPLAPLAPLAYEVEAVKGTNSTRLYRQETKRINGKLVTKHVLLCQHPGSHDECIAEANGENVNEALIQQEKEALAVVPVQQIRREMRRGDWDNPGDQQMQMFPEDWDERRPELPTRARRRRTLPHKVSAPMKGE